MKIRYLLIAQFLAWAGYTIIDLIDESTFFFQDFERLTSIQLYFVMYFSIPIILAVLYFIRKKSLWNSERKRPLIKQIIRFMILILIWILITVISTIFISILVLNNIWFVRYSYEILPVIQYLFFGFWLLVISTGLVLVGELLILIIVKCSSYWSLHKRNCQGEY